ncbi:type IV pilus assembly protein PilA [Proteiniborus ethanoligenes]|uniref:Type IV pilus assembly protein PilA n=1 Tax=Proteiniborus ethanoligenes TaxID=415015 RepID=A0A1H3K5X9_9FIRM|nr:type II secretion system protein [Proteiniborus ethanoligenes]SDY47612.1 type IV pilus assembly protein PilA [Proteiniborus ethanoligenes]
MFEFILKQLKSKKGFTLVELVVVIAILGILAAIAVPRLGGFSDGAKKAKVEAEHRQLISAIQMWQANSSDVDSFPSNLDALKDYFDDIEKVKETKQKDGSTLAHAIDSDKKTLTSTWDPDTNNKIEWVYPTPAGD